MAKYKNRKSLHRVLFTGVELWDQRDVMCAAAMFLYRPKFRRLIGV
jgi:hypothetical protein